MAGQEILELTLASKAGVETVPHAVRVVEVGVPVDAELLAV